MSQPRIRRRPDEAKSLILKAAEELLIEGGPRAIEVRAVAERVGMTDAGINHHFQGRDGLLVALLRHGGGRVRAAVEHAAQDWVRRGARVAELVDCIATVYEDGYGELAMALHAAGWRDDGGGILDPVVDALHAARKKSGGHRPARSDTRLAVAALHQALATESAYGAAFRRSAGIAEPEASQHRQQRRWWVRTLVTVLDIDQTATRARS
ncbi:TetR/AcrR family transcriptional regulator [Mycobacterium marseillense]|uniref:TetR/AcrR family transcriptional regulator n=1 Tax=Mycobacterium marseillense TaxID=701042 RepID=UPI000B27306E|nr:TetR/AcrR family transcriptional regulator [Mycobacterium marseillense]MCA2263253.1 TetR/AcrR family transcriptional regulator [Mycobacterium marseillense]